MGHCEIHESGLDVSVPDPVMLFFSSYTGTDFSGTERKSHEHFFPQDNCIYQTED